MSSQKKCPFYNDLCMERRCMMYSASQETCLIQQFFISAPDTQRALKKLLEYLGTEKRV